MANEIATRATIGAKSPNVGGTVAKTEVRVAVVEIGSRAVRVLIADIGPEHRLQPVFHSSEHLHLMAAIQGFIATARETATRMGAHRTIVVGTEAIRQIDRLPGYAAQLTADGITSLDPDAEALCSLTSAAYGLPGSSSLEATLALDQGTGSMQIVLGTTSPSICMHEYCSLALGTDELLLKFEKSDWRVDRLRNELCDSLATLSFDSVRIGRAIVQGSTATKCGLLTVNGPEKGRYDPKRVHGVELSTNSLREMVALFERTPRPGWSKLRELFDHGNPTSNEMERTLAGAVALVLILERFKCSSFLVNAYGTRYGIAWQLGKEDRPDSISAKVSSPKESRAGRASSSRPSKAA